MKYLLTLLLVLACAVPASAQTTAVPLGPCTLHAYLPYWYSDGYVRGHAEIACSDNHHLQIKVCVQQAYPHSVSDPVHCALRPTSGTVYGADFKSTSYGFVPAPNTWWRTWVWGYADGSTAYYESSFREF